MQANPSKAPSQEVMMRMSQRIERSQHPGDKTYNDAQSQSRQLNESPLGNNTTIGGGHQDGDKESPIVALEPEEPGLKQGSAFLPKTNKTQDPGAGQGPSLYLQEKTFIKQREQEQLLKAEEYHVVKTKEFTVTGRLRQDKPVVKAMQKGAPQTELNEKFITTECIADRRIKISSMAPRQYMNAPSVEDVRKQGQHQMILSAIEKKQTFAELINQANAMVTSVLHDPLKRCFNVLPTVLKFGMLKVDTVYELTISLKNEDSVAQRLNLKPLADARVKAVQTEMGLVAPGMIRKVLVTVHAKEPGTIKETLNIVTKSDIFKIPIEATILSAMNYERELEEQRALNKSITNSRVRERLNQSIQRARQSAPVQPPKPKRVPREDGEEGEEEDQLDEEMEAEMDADMEA